MRYLLFSFLTLIAAVLPGQTMGNYQHQRPATVVNYQPRFRAVPRPAALPADPRVVEFTVNALANQPASAYTAIFSVYQAGATVREVDAALNERVQTMMAALRGLGIPEEDVHVDLVNFLPTYAFSEENKIFSKKSLTEVPTGFRLQKNLHVRYRDAALLERIITAATTAGIYDIIKVDELVDDPQAVYADLRQRAFAYLDQIRATYTEGGIPLDSATLSLAENTWVVYPADRYETYTAHATQQLAEEEAKEAKVSRLDKPTLRFYDAISVADFDVVVNPDVLVPTAQFTFSLRARFRLPEPPEAASAPAERTYLYLTPDGKIVPLPPTQTTAVK